MDAYSAKGFIQAFIRFSCEVGYPKFMVIDEGSQLIKGCDNMRMSFTDTKGKLHRDMMVDLTTCPVGGHNYNGKVEPRIRHVKESLEKTISNEWLSVLQWETIAAEVLNAINDLPLSLGNIVSHFENMDLITPNGLKLGRNNERSPVSPIKVVGNHLKVLEENKKIFRVWFETWLISLVPKLMEQPKWFRSDRDVKIWDVVLFIKNESSVVNTYQYGMVHEIELRRNGIIWKVAVKYRNSIKNMDHFTTLAVHELGLIQPVDKIHGRIGKCCYNE